VKSLAVRATLAALCALSLSGCIDSAKPVLTDAQPVFGQKLRLQFYTLNHGVADEPERATYRWNGARYAHTSGGMRDIGAFSVHPFEAGDFIIQSVPARHPDMTEYAVMHKLVDGVFQVVPIDEADADEPTRAANCGKGDKADTTDCRIETRDQLLAFARATAASRKNLGGLVLRLPDAPEKPKRPAQRRPRGP
jgi:hypothetical protein